MEREAYKSYEPSADLIMLAQQHLAFLREVDTISEQLLKPHVMANAVRRYETCWLHILCNHTEADLLPPLDVHWAWHVHMLSPCQYASDLNKVIWL